jgi:hypothetical protein
MGLMFGRNIPILCSDFLGQIGLSILLGEIKVDSNTKYNRNKESLYLPQSSENKSKLLLRQAKTLAGLSQNTGPEG